MRTTQPEILFALSISLALLVCACTRKLSCVPGQSASCVCTDGRSGAQSCQSDGTYGACVCQNPIVPSLPVPAIPGLPAIPGMPTPPSGPTVPPTPPFPFPFPSIPAAPGAGAAGSTAVCTQARACCTAIAADPSLVQIEGLCQMGAWGGAMAANNPQFSSAYCGYVMTSVSALLSGYAMEAQRSGRPFTYPAACRATMPP